MNCNILYLPIGVPTFDMKVAESEFNDSIKNLSNKLNIDFPGKPLLDIGTLREFIEPKTPDLVILQNLTFANSDYVMEVVRNFKCPIVIWTLKEKYVDGNRLRLNSLTGAYSASNFINMYDDNKVFYIYGASDDPEVVNYIYSVASAINVRKELKNLNIASIGTTPDGFGFGQALSIELFKYFGTKLLTVESRELMEKAESYEQGEYVNYFNSEDNNLFKYNFLENSQIDRSARLLKAYEDYIKNNNIGALSSRCWPDYFNRYKAPVCGILSVLNDNLLAASCEGDIYGALSMFIGNKLSNKAVFFGDPVHIDVTENLLYFWHCGMGACSLSSTEEKIGVHPNRKMGPVMDFVSKPEPEVTIFRVGRKKGGGVRFFVAQGEAVKKEKPFQGTSVVVKMDTDIKELVNTSVMDGWEPHFVVIYKNVVDELLNLAKILDIEVQKY